MTEKTVMIRGKARRVRVMPNGMYRFLKGKARPHFTQDPDRKKYGMRKLRRVAERAYAKEMGHRRVKTLARRRRFGRRRGRRSYGRRFARHFRGMGIPSIAGLGLTFYTLQKFGFFDAGSRILAGDLVGAASTIAGKASSVNTYIGPVMGGLALKGVRSVAGPMVLGKVGKHSIRLW